MAQYFLQNKYAQVFTVHTLWSFNVPMSFLVGILNIIMYLSMRRDATLFELSNPKSQCSQNSTHDLLLHRSQIDSTSSSAWDPQHAATAAYEVCVAIGIGHDGGKASKTALPFSVLWRFFQTVFQLKGIEGEEFGLAIYIKIYLKAKEGLWKVKYFTMQKYNLQKIL